MIGFTARVSINSRQMTSEAIAEPPGLSMRMTTARMELSARTFRSHSTKVSEPSTEPLGPSKLDLPLAIVPTAYSSATLSPRPDDRDRT